MTKDIDDATFEQLFEQLPAAGWLTKGEAYLLGRAVLAAEGDVLEVGTYYGRSTILLCKLLEGSARRVYSVDPFAGFDDNDPDGDRIDRTFSANVQKHGVHNLSHFRMKIEDWPIHPCGFAYLDGDHSYRGTLNQIAVAKKCGVREFCAHDYAKKGGGIEVAKAIMDSGPISITKIAGTMAYCQFL